MVPKKPKKKVNKFTICEKCGKNISGRLIYGGGAVWHPKCYPYQEKLKTATKLTSKTGKRK